MRNIYLNDFRPQVIFSLIEVLFNNDHDLIVADSQGLSLKEAEDFEFLTLMYDSLFHRLIIKPLWLSEPIFTNPDCICEIASLNAFIKAVQPTDEYRKLMTSKYE